MAVVNIPRDVTDAFYRYKMPALIAKVEGRGNGIKTVIVNMADVAKSLDRPPSYTTKFFGFELGALTTIDADKDRYIVNGKHDQETLAKALDGFIERFVLCKKCGRNPETKMVFRKDVIILHCIACGNDSPVDMRHKLASYIQKNPSDVGGADDGASKKDRKRNKKSKKEASSSEEDEGFEEEKTAKPVRSKKGDEEGEEEVVWSTDTSKEAVEARKKQMLDDTSELAAKLLSVATQDKEEEAEVEAEEQSEAPRDPIQLLTEFNQKNPTNEKLAAEVRKVTAEEKWTDEQASQVVFYLLFTADVLKQLKLAPKVALLKEFASTKKGQLGVINGVVQLIAAHKSLMKSAPHILKGLYDEDVLEEEALLAWHEKKSKGVNQKVKEASAVFIEWLKNAEEESDEDDDDEEDEEEEEEDD